MKHLISFVASHIEELLTLIFKIPELYFLGEKDREQDWVGKCLKIVAVIVVIIFLGMCYQDSLWSREPEQGQMTLSPVAVKPVIIIVIGITAALITAVIAYLTKKKPEKIKEYLKNHGKFLVLSVILIAVGALLSHWLLEYINGSGANPPETVATPSLSIGEMIPFGTYNPDEKSDSESKAIEWMVLDVQGNKALLLSRKALDSKPYNDTYGKITWEDSTLCHWLNNEFKNSAFTEEEQAAILETKTEQDGNDLIFLLSYEEVLKYFPDEQDRICKPTDYVLAMPERTRAINDGTEFAVWWWLRSLTEDGTQAFFVNFEGKCFENRVGNTYLSVRPALWLDLETYDSLQPVDASAQ